jgi:hypothetical protein
MNSPKLVAVALFSFAALAIGGCSAATDEDVAGSDVDGQDEELKNSTCGGFAGIACPDGYECQLAGNYPDASGTCHKLRYEGKVCGGFVKNPPTCPKGYSCILDGKTPDMPGHCHKDPKVCVQNVMCMSNAHWDGTLCKCVTNVTCKTLTCSKGYHCETKGLNGGSTAVCIKN